MATQTPTALIDWLVAKQFLSPSQGEDARSLLHPDIHSLVRDLVRRAWLTPYQANQLLQGKADTLVLGPFRLLERLGEGSMGQVVKARQVPLGWVVALKIIRKELIANAKALERFRREVVTASQLRHPNIVAAHDAGEIGPCQFLAMEFIDGTDLSRLVKHRGPLPLAKACDYIHQAALGLQHAYEQGVVHRDIKPGNLLLARGGEGQPDQVKILDFGLARFVCDDGNAGRLTQVGNILGTVDYIAPEQAEDARTADIRADIYSLGCSLYYLLTARPPFAGTTVVEKVSARLLGETPLLRAHRPDVPAALEAVLQQMMARDPARRFQTPVEVAAALEPFTRPESFPASLSLEPLAYPAEIAAVGTVVPRAIPLAQPVATAGSTEPQGSFATLAELAPSDKTVPPPPARPKPRKPFFLVLAGAGGALLLLLLIILVPRLFQAGRNPNAYPPEAALRLIPLSEVSLKPGKNQFVEIKIQRLKFHGPVEIKVHGLPNGVVASAPPIPEDKDSVLLKLMASYGTPPGQKEVVVTALAKNLKAESSLDITIQEDVDPIKGKGAGKSK